LILEVYEQLGLLLFFCPFPPLLSLMRGHGLMNKYSSNINSTAATLQHCSNIAAAAAPAAMIMK